MKVPRNVDANKLINILKHYGYEIIRQTGSHIRLSKKLDKGEHIITVPNHAPIKIGTLQNIVKDVCFINKYDINNFYSQL
jgi:predicted RNA binding protein YcfA (HicA-like mRNA interferase family)